MKYVYLVHYDNSTHEPEFYIFSTFEGAKRKVEKLIDGYKDENGDSGWEQLDVGNIANLRQWSNGQAYLSIWKKEVLT